MKSNTAEIGIGILASLILLLTVVACWGVNDANANTFSARGSLIAGAFTLLTLIFALYLGFRESVRWRDEKKSDRAYDLSKEILKALLHVEIKLNYIATPVVWINDHASAMIIDKANHDKFRKALNDAQSPIIELRNHIAVAAIAFNDSRLKAALKDVMDSWTMLTLRLARLDIVTFDMVYSNTRNQRDFDAAFFAVYNSLLQDPISNKDAIANEGYILAIANKIQLVRDLIKDAAGLDRA